MMKWRYEFDENGGLDHMYGSFTIYDGENRYVCEIDQGGHGERPAADSHLPRPECEAIAELIVDSVNARMEKESNGMKIFSNSSWVKNFVYVDFPSSDPALIKRHLTAEETDKDILS